MSNDKTSQTAAYIQLDDAGLLDLVHRGNVDSVRRYFDQSLRGRDIIRPTWQHLRVAIEAYNIPMAKLLVTWGAQPSKEELQAMYAERGAKAVRDTLCMQHAKVNLSGMTAVKTASQTKVSDIEQAPAPKSTTRIVTPDDIPQEWKDVLKALHDGGAPEAVIAGGALRDLTHGRKVKDVDIFLADRWMTKRFIKKAFERAGVKIQEQQESTGYGTVSVKMTASRAQAFEKVEQKTSRDNYGAIFEHAEVKSGAQAWTVIAGDNKTEYNIVFIKGQMGKDMSVAYKWDDNKVAHAHLLLSQFDIGICQISYNGRAIQTLADFRNDVADQTLTLVRANHASKEHLQRIVAKYPDFAPCPQSCELLGLPKTPTAQNNTKADKKKDAKVTEKFNQASKPQSPADSTGFTRSYDSTGFISSYRSSRRGGWSGY